MHKPLLRNPNRCPSCNRFGSPKYGGYCKQCNVKIQTENKDVPLVRSQFKPNYGQGFIDQERNPTSFGIVKDSFGVIEK